MPIPQLFEDPEAEDKILIACGKLHRGEGKLRQEDRETPLRPDWADKISSSPLKPRYRSIHKGRKEDGR